MASYHYSSPAARAFDVKQLIWEDKRQGSYVHGFHGFNKRYLWIKHNNLSWKKNRQIGKGNKE